MKRRLLGVAAALFGVAAVQHVVGLIRPDAAVYDPPLRHALFVAVNLACAAGFAAAARGRELRALPWFFAVLVAQQLVSHGSDAWRAWTLEHRVDVASIAVLLFMPAALALLVSARAQDGPRT